MHHVSSQHTSLLLFQSKLVTPWSGITVHICPLCCDASVCFQNCLLEHAHGGAHERILCSCSCGVTGRGSPGGRCDGQISYLWFKDWRGSEREERRGGFPSEGVDIEAAVRFVLPACLALSSLIIFSAWGRAFATRVPSKAWFTMQRPKESATSY